jgi:hypothetical protein
MFGMSVMLHSSGLFYCLEDGGNTHLRNVFLGAQKLVVSKLIIKLHTLHQIRGFITVFIRAHINTTFLETEVHEFSKNLAATSKVRASQG